MTKKLLSISIFAIVFSANLMSKGLEITVSSMDSDAGRPEAVCPVFFCWQGEANEIESSLHEQSLPDLLKIAKARKFEGAHNAVEVVTTLSEGKAKHAMFVGLGAEQPEDFENVESLRRGVCKAVAKARDLGLEHLTVEFCCPDEFGLKEKEMACQIATSATLAEYQFDDFKQKKGDVAEQEWSCNLELIVSEDEDDVCAGVERGKVIGQAMNWARHMSDLPPNIATPPYIAGKAREMADDCGLECTIIPASKAKVMGMGGFWAVQSGSEFEGQFIILEYKCGKSDAKKVGLVGKGVTFDSGGVSLKSWQAMTGMKYDMCGAAAVMATGKAISELKPKVDVVIVAPMVENMPGGGSYRQDDILTHYNGKTSEIGHTDAEGRLILADALAFTDLEHNPDLIIDLATLTHAGILGLGHFYSSLMTKNNTLAQALIKHGQRTGDWLWRVPFHRFYKNMIKSTVADVSNVGSSECYAEAITAGKFLENFVRDKTPWAHLDICGTAMCVPNCAYSDGMATGVGVRLLTDFLTNFDDGYVF